jgi:hypothetical protein
MTIRSIYVRFQKSGIHCYPNAATEDSLKDVSYLGTPHRHLFKFEVEIEVYHDDREVEFHQFLNWLESLYNSPAEPVLELSHKSCEMLCDELLEQIVKKFPGRAINIDISEDGECGARAYYYSAE